MLHEFGHVLGLIEEMNNPNNTIHWNVGTVYRDMQGQHNWTRAQVDYTILKKCQPEDCPNYRQFDQKSIMIFPIPAAWTLDGFNVGSNAELSESDTQFVQQLYPKP